VTTTTADISRLGLVDEAKGMRISRVEPVLLSYTYPPDDVQTWSGGALPGITAGLVRVTTEDGLTGIGETYAANYAPEVVRALVEHFSRYLVGADPADVEGLWRECYSRTLYWGRFGIAISVLSGIESALWDLVGKAAGKPVHALLGTVHSRLPRYASGGMDAAPDKLRREQSGYAAAGFLASKIRAGVSADADYDKAALSLDALGPGVGLAVDAVQGSNPKPWSADEAIAVARRLEPLGLLWLEEPCAATDVEGYAAVRRAVDIPIAGAESCTTTFEFQRYLDADALDLAQPDAAHIGGILETRRAAVLAEAKGVPIAVHAWASGACLMANYHAAFASPNCQWLEYPTQPNPLVTALLAEPLTVEDGHVLAPTAPGLGVSLTPELEQQYPYKPDHHYNFQERR
jgi:D-arabinonate dehydratase/D-galactarolactone cycloisomerase